MALGATGTSPPHRTGLPVAFSASASADDAAAIGGAPAFAAERLRARLACPSSAGRWRRSSPGSRRASAPRRAPAAWPASCSGPSRTRPDEPLLASITTILAFCAIGVGQALRERGRHEIADDERRAWRLPPSRPPRLREPALRPAGDCAAAAAAAPAGPAPAASPAARAPAAAPAHRATHIGAAAPRAGTAASGNETRSAAAALPARLARARCPAAALRPLPRE